MVYEFKNLSDVDQLDQLSGSTTIMGFDNGKPVQFSTDKVGSVKTVNGSAPDENGNIEIQIATDIDWDGLNNKPFNEEGIINVEALPEALQFGKTTVQGDTLEWDGNTEGLVSVNANGDDQIIFCKVSDTVPTIDELDGMLMTLSNGNEPSPIVEELESGYIMCGEFCVIVPESVSEPLYGLVFPEAGIYFEKTDEFYVTSITIPGYSGFTKTEVKTIDEDLLPEGYVVNFAANGDGTYSADKTFAEVQEQIEAGNAVSARIVMGENVYVITTYFFNKNMGVEFTLISAAGGGVMSLHLVLLTDNTVDKRIFTLTATPMGGES